MSEPTIQALLRRLHSLGVQLWVEGERLRYDAPKGALDEGLLAELRRLKPELLAFLQDLGQSRRPIPPIGRAPRQGPLPLSFAQERMWFLHEFQSEGQGRATYNMTGALRLEGPLDVEALRAAFTTIVARHEALRTRFHLVDGALQSVIVPPNDVPLPVIALEADGPAAREAEVHRRSVEEALRPFDLSAEPLLRTLLFRLEDQSHVLLVNMHHLVSDGWSLGVLIRELGALYRAFHAGQPSPLPELAVQYPDYAAWQRTWLTGEVLERQLAFWRTHLQQLPTLLELPTDRPRPPLQSYRGALVPVMLDAELTQRLNVLCKQQRATPFMALLALYAALLARHSGAEALTVGTPVANRRPGTEPLIGFFMNTLVIPVQVDPEASFLALLDHVRRFSMDAQMHPDVPFEQLVDALRPERSLSHTPLFQVMFIMQNAPIGALELPALQVSPFEVERVTSKFDLTLSLEEKDGRLTGWLEYSSDLFNRSTAERMAAQYARLLRSALDAPGRPLHGLGLLSVEEERAIGACRGPALALPPEDRVHTLIEAQAARHPDRAALLFEDASLTYGELDARADQLAHYLRQQGVGPEATVGLLLGRSLEMVVGMLGILKAGGAYLPLDPGMPRPRLAHVLKDSGAQVVITAERWLHQLPETDVAVLVLEREQAALARCPQTAPAVPTSPRGAAYVIYTSGSTGLPKAVVIEHRNVVNFFFSMDQALGESGDGPAPPGTWLALTTFSFDISILELLWTLARGFRVVIQGERESYFGVPEATRPAPQGPVDFSLLYFASADGGRPGRSKYRLLLDGARFADQHGFAAVWIPERHFHEFGEIFPNPSVPAAAVAAVTKRVQIRAGSVVLPLHHPLRIVEEWAVVDNLSDGRVALSFASGWHADDFVFAPDNYARRKELLIEGVERVRRLWRGEPGTWSNGVGAPIEVRPRPRPIQPELEVWVTAAGNPDTFRVAGELGANVLTHLLGQSVEEVAKKIAVYREARARHGHAPAAGKVTLMLHTFVGRDLDEVRETVRGPMREYLRSSLDLLSNLAKAVGMDLRSASFTPADMDALLDHAFERYFENSGLFGTVEGCVEIVGRLQAIGVTELACLIDFGVPVEQVLASLELLDAVRRLSNQPPRAPSADHSIAAQIARRGVTHLQCTPSLARMLLGDSSSREALRGLRTLCVGGEELPLPLARELGAAVGGAVHNMYGPTETTIWSSTRRLQPEDELVTIGRPIGNTSIHILDRYLQPVPLGAVGELYIGGEGVARGYHNRPELTSERFVALLSATGARERLYRTGDLGRLLESGEIAFLGRGDNQVKIRGFRIELGEIEAALGRVAGVSACAVVARARAGGDKVLDAYVVPAPGVAFEPEALRRTLAGALPEYMMPSSFTRLDALPQTPNGKLDRRALPAPEAARAQAGAAAMAPRDVTELRLARLWHQVLGAERIGVTDNFFEIGGHSLLAVRLLSAVEEEFGRKLPLATLFRAPTIEALARAIQEHPAQAGDLGALVKIRDGDRSLPPLFVLPGAGGNVLYFHDLVRHLDVGAAVYGLQAVHTGGDDSLEQLVFTIADRYLQEIRALQPKGPYHLIGHSFGGWIAFEIAQRLLKKGQRVALLGILDSPAPIHLESPIGMDWDSAKWVQVLAGVVERLYDKPLGIEEAALRGLDKRAQIAVLTERMSRLGLLPPGVDAGRLEGFYEIFRADQLTVYTPAGPYPAQVTLFRAIEANPENARGPEMIPILEDPQLGWTPFSAQPIEVFDVPGDHLTMMREPHVQALAAAIRGRLGGTRPQQTPALAQASGG